MKTKSFQNYLEKRLNREEIKTIEQQVETELQALQTMQQDITHVIKNYIAREKIGFNELVRRLGISPTQVLKIQKSEANLTLATIAHIAALLNMQPHIIFKSGSNRKN